MSQLKVRREAKKGSRAKHHLKTKKQELKKKGKQEKHVKDYLELAKLIMEGGNYSWYSHHENASCLSCNHVAKAMIRTGALIFCVECFNSIFDPRAKERDKKEYKKWLDIQQDKWESETS